MALPGGTLDITFGLIGGAVEPSGGGSLVVTRPAHSNPYEFVALCALRAQQLLAGSVPRLDGVHSATTMAQMEVAAGHVTRVGPDAGPKQCGWQR